MYRWPQFTVDLEGVSLHFVHQRSQREDAIPLLLVHGWPGSFYEFYGLIEQLTNPPSGEPAFHVIIPSVPGFLFSSTPQMNGWTVKDTGRILDALVTEVLGYSSYAMQGGDWVSTLPCSVVSFTSWSRARSSRRSCRISRAVKRSTSTCVPSLRRTRLSSWA